MYKVRKMRRPSTRHYEAKRYINSQRQIRPNTPPNATTSKRESRILKPSHILLLSSRPSQPTTPNVNFKGSNHQPHHRPSHNQHQSPRVNTNNTKPRINTTQNQYATNKLELETPIRPAQKAAKSYPSLHSYHQPTGHTITSPKYYPNIIPQ